MIVGGNFVFFSEFNFVVFVGLVAGFLVAFVGAGAGVEMGFGVGEVLTFGFVEFFLVDVFFVFEV